MSTLALLLPFAQIILGCPYRGPLRGAKRVELLFCHRRDTAVLAHPDDIEPFLRLFIHPVFAFQLGDDALDRALYSKGLAATDAFGRLFLLHDLAQGSGSTEIDLRLKAYDFLRTGRLA